MTWDSAMPDEFVNEWQKIKNEMPLILDLKFARWLQMNADSPVHLFGYCDASMWAYGTCVYARHVDENGEVHMNLIMAKARVAPVKQLTIPKLELCAAVLLTKVIKQVTTAMNRKFEAINLFSDSRIVLDWINADPMRYKAFLATRLKKINELKNVTWSHINGIHNPADCVSRGILPSELMRHILCWSATNAETIHSSDEDDEAKEECNDNNDEYEVVSLTVSNDKQSFLPSVSSIYKLQRIMAYVLRFIKICKKETVNNRIGVNECRAALTTIVKYVQQKYFGKEIALLRDGNELNRKNVLRKLTVFLDDDDILRVGGRLNNADCGYDRKHQMIMPRNDEVTVLLIRGQHLIGLHSGPKLTEMLLRQKFWIIDMKRVVKKIVRECVTCAKFQPRTRQQLMGNLPERRVNQPSKVFLHSAVDFAGPIYVKTSTLRASKTVKSYIAVFACMATKAIHLEAVGDLSAEKFIAALRRFIGRRGQVQSIHSDSGTNFVAANRLLHEMTENEKEQFDEKLNDELLRQNIEWHFVPPGSPHMNGLAEAAVKTMKFHLKRSMGELSFTFEELSTLLCQVEAVVNSRPLCELSSEPSEYESLTPAHFLNMTPSYDVPDDDFSETKSSYLNRWQRVQRTVQQFWRSWKDEYSD